MLSNIGGPEVVFVLLVALIVLGPTKLPEAARQAGKMMTEVRRISNGFQREFREAIQEPIAEAEAAARGAIDQTRFAVSEPFKAVGKDLNDTAKAAETAGTTPAATETTAEPAATPDESATPPNDD